MKSKKKEERSGKAIAQLSGQKEKSKNQTKQQPLEKIPHNQHECGQAPLKTDLGGPAWPAVFGKTLEKRKEIVQYHPPRGKP